MEKNTTKNGGAMARIRVAGDGIPATEEVLLLARIQTKEEEEAAAACAGRQQPTEETKGHPPPTRGGGRHLPCVVSLTH